MKGSYLHAFGILEKKVSRYKIIAGALLAIIVGSACGGYFWYRSHCLRSINGLVVLCFTDLNPTFTQPSVSEPAPDPIY